MKLSFVISTQPTQFQAATYSPDLEANIARLAQLGYDGVELAVRDPSLIDVTYIRRILDKHHMQVPAVGTGQAWGEERLSFTDPDTLVRERAVQRIKSHIPLATELGAIIILGLIRGVARPPVSDEQAREWLVSSLKDIVHAAGDLDVRFAIEPINRYETNLLNTVEETQALIDAVGDGNLGILFDTFHSNIEEPNLEGSMADCRDRLYHVHIADSNRWSPGSGHLDWGSILSALERLNYSGWISAEILP